MKKIIHSNNLKRLQSIVNLKKVGIHWFTKCMFCNDGYQNLCFHDGLKTYCCYNKGCKVAGSIDEFFEHFNNVDKNNLQQLQII